jgi:hypothetical protein
MSGGALGEKAEGTEVCREEGFVGTEEGGDINMRS